MKTKNIFVKSRQSKRYETQRGNEKYEDTKMRRRPKDGASPGSRHADKKIKSNRDQV